ILSWVYGKRVTTFADMTNLSKEFRRDLDEVARISSINEITRTVAQDRTVKFLLGLEDGLSIETVMIPEDRRRTVCVSSQVGCGLGCRFCVTALMGFLRNLSPAEIIDQVLTVRRHLQERDEDVTNVVMMGMGEPLLNYHNVVKAVRLMQSELGMAFGQRRITISTAGYVPGILRLAKEGLKVGLAISLNGSHDGIRGELMPINRKYPIGQVLEAAREFYQRVGRRITFEYVLIDGVTDSPEDAERVARIAHSVPSKVNLIPLNLGASPDLHRSSPLEIETFISLLVARYVTVTLRESRGDDIYAACGQLGGTFNQGQTPLSPSPFSPRVSP
ncbi:MAG: 23S rRNA (adenine(2503)-C(2))-methyltransferase RlmN, partial [Candidatus Latescibacteria bacterium]|nr:23S rRNA (adenine(2503)-C(2))-methyltransferase RlmN [Candidatus Latescibacterota bacterium]